MTSKGRDMKARTAECRMGVFAPAIAVLSLAAALSACNTNAPEPSQIARSASETAPADLQLLCADAAAKATGTPANRVLPVTSRKVDATTYQVSLNVGSSTSVCIIDEAGNVTSMQPSAT